MSKNMSDSLLSGNSSEESKEQSKFTLNKFEFDLFNEEDNVVHRLIRVKRSANSKEEKWKIFDDNKVILTIEGSKLTNKEKEFLRTVNGVTWLIAKAKEGFKSLNALKNEMKKEIK